MHATKVNNRLSATISVRVPSVARTLAAVSAMKGSASVGVRVRWKTGLRYDTRNGPASAKKAMSATIRIVSSAKRRRAAPGAVSNARSAPASKKPLRLPQMPRVRVPQIDGVVQPRGRR
jgi:hypothetical protein